MRKITLISIITIMLVPFCALAEVPIELLSHIGGHEKTYSIAVSGDYAYTGTETSFLVMDISNKSTPAQLSRIDLGYYSTGIVTRDNLVYACGNAFGFGDGRLHIIDVANPASSKVIGQLDTSAACDVKIDGDYAYIADGEDGLRVIDVSNPNEPNLIASYNPLVPGGFAHHIAIADGIAYLTDEWQEMLYLVGISQPNQPVLISKYDTGSGSHGIAVRGDYAYIANGLLGLNIIDVSFIPRSIGVCDTPGYAYGVALAGTYAYVVDAQGDLHAIDVSDPCNPYIVGSYQTGISSYRLTIQNNLAFVPNSETGFDIVDLSDVEFGEFSLVGRFAMSQAARHVSIVGSTACLTDEYTGLNLFDISNPAAPACIGGYDSPIWDYDARYAEAAIIKNNTAYFGWLAQMEPMDITDPVNPSPGYDSWTLGDAISEMIIDDDILYTTILKGGLYSFYIGNGVLCPLQLGYRDIDFTVRNLAVNANLAYIANDIGGLIILDVNDPEHFSPMGSCDTNGIAYGVDLAGSYAVVADYNDGLKTIDISDPCNPVQVGSVGTPSYAADVTVTGSLALIADGDSGLRVASIKDPCTPSIITGLDFEGFAKSIDNNGKIAIIAAEEGGFYILQIGEPADLEPDGDIDLDDLTILMQQWLNACEKPYGCSNADINNDTIVNFADFAELAAQWQ